MQTRVNPVGWILVAFFLLGGIAFWVAIPEIYIGQIWVFVALVLAGVYYLVGRAAAGAKKLMQEGLHGQATILGMEQTGVYINEQPQVRLRLRVEASGMTPYEIEKKAVVPLIALGSLSTGRPLSVYIDREDRERMTIDWGASMGGAAPGAAPVSISSGGGPAVSIGSDPNAVQAVTDALHQHGIAPAGTIDLRQNPAAREAVLNALKNSGVDAAHDAAAADPTVPVAPASEEDAPLERLTKLMQLKGAQLITDKEFEEHKARILKAL